MLNAIPSLQCTQLYCTSLVSLASLPKKNCCPPPSSAAQDHMEATECDPCSKWYLIIYHCISPRRTRPCTELHSSKKQNKACASREMVHDRLDIFIIGITSCSCRVVLWEKQKGKRRWSLCFVASPSPLPTVMATDRRMATCSCMDAFCEVNLTFSILNSTFACQ